MKITALVRKLEKQLKNAEKLTAQYDAHANRLRKRLGSVAQAVGQKLNVLVSPKQKAGRRKKRKMSKEGRARVVAAQKKRWTAWKAKKAAGKK